MAEQETSRRLLHFCVPRVVAVSPHMRLVEDNPSSLSLLDIYKQVCVIIILTVVCNHYEQVCVIIIILTGVCNHYEQVCVIIIILTGVCNRYCVIVIV